MGERLTALDATFLELEEADDGAHMHIGAVMVLAGPAPPVESVRGALEARLDALPLYTQRLSSVRTGGLRWPSWEQDPDFDIARHVRRRRLPETAGRDELLEWAADYFSLRLDRRHPLWEVSVVEISPETWALVSKTHHCLVDGVGSVDAAKVLLDTEQNADAPPSPASHTATSPKSEANTERTSALRRIPAASLRAGAGILKTGAGALEGGAHALGAALDPHTAQSALHQSRAAIELVVRDEFNAAPKTSINRPIGPNRALAVVPIEFERLREIRTALGGTVNDVVLAITTGGLRALFLHRGEEPPEASLRAMVPVNIRPAADKLALGNRVSSLFVGLPVGIEDPLIRFRAQVDEAEGLKSSTQADGSRGLMDIAALAPPALHSFLAQALFATRLFNVTITNVPGPREPLYVLGSKVEEIWPLVPLAADHAIGIAALSYTDRLFLCLNADRDAVEDLDVLAQAITAELDHLTEIATGPVSERVAG